MKSVRSLVAGALLRVALMALIAETLADPGCTLQAQRAAPQGYLTGVVRSSQGPEAGV